MIIMPYNRKKHHTRKFLLSGKLMRKKFNESIFKSKPTSEKSLKPNSMDKRNQNPQHLIPFAEDILARMNQHGNDISTTSSEEIQYIRAATSRYDPTSRNCTHMSRTSPFNEVAEEVLFFVAQHVL
jgi:hypothetical protein